MKTLSLAALVAGLLVSGIASAQDNPNLVVSGIASAQDSAQDYPNLAPRCWSDALQDGAAALDPCAIPFAQFGLSGPLAMQGESLDVEMTGSILPRNNIHDTTQGGDAAQD